MATVRQTWHYLAMSTHLDVMTLTLADLDRVRRGDIVTAIDGRPVRFRITGRYGPVGVGDNPAVPMETAAGIPVNLYPGSNVESSITIERKTRPVVRTFDNVTFHYDKENDEWFTADRDWQIKYGEAGVTTCEFPHPVRESKGRGYYCPGQEQHHYSGWMTHHDGSQGTVEYYESFTAAAKAIAAEINKSA